MTAVTAIPPPAATPSGAPLLDGEPARALVAEATSRSGLVWVAVPGRPEPPRAAWHRWHDGALWLLLSRDGTGPEQTVPGLLGAALARVTVRSRDTGGRIATYDAAVRVVHPDTDDPGAAGEWEAVVPLLAEARLNPPDGLAAAPARWRRECVLVRLEPRLPLREGPGAMPTG